MFMRGDGKRLSGLPQSSRAIIAPMSSASHTTADDSAGTRLSGTGSGILPRLLMWLILSVLVALVAYFGFRGYLNPELLFHFANGLHC
jgi:hypothetical protein